MSFLGARSARPQRAIASALAAAYHALGFQTLADQVRRSVRSVRGNQWMFRMGHPADHPLRLRPELLQPRPCRRARIPILAERTPVRMDLSHSGWSDIFFLGMDFPEGARVLNVSMDLGVRGRDPQPQPPIEVYLRVIDEPVLRLVSVDLKCKADITTLAEVFDFAKDYLGLLKAAVIAAGIVPPGPGRIRAETGRPAGPTGRPGPGAGNRQQRERHSQGLAAGRIDELCWRRSSPPACGRPGQVQSLTGPLSETERRLVAARAILGEWLGGSGGGWQDSGGVWPGIKMIEGRTAGRAIRNTASAAAGFLPDHHIYTDEVQPPDAAADLR